MIQPKLILDLRGEVCPVPAMYAGARLATMQMGEVLEVIVDHLCAVEGLPAAVSQSGHKVIALETIDRGVYRIQVEAHGPPRL